VVELRIPVAKSGLLLRIEVCRREVPPGSRGQPEGTLATHVAVHENGESHQVRLVPEVVDGVFEQSRGIVVAWPRGIGEIVIYSSDERVPLGYIVWYDIPFPPA
jgi:hypothetical protein